MADSYEKFVEKIVEYLQNCDGTSQRCTGFEEFSDIRQTQDIRTVLQKLQVLVTVLNDLSSTLKNKLKKREKAEALNDGNHLEVDSEPISLSVADASKSATSSRTDAANGRPTTTVADVKLDSNEACVRFNRHSNIVQITANKSEIERRIDAFVEKKQIEIDEINKREFCNLIKDDPDYGCARTDAVFVPRAGGKSHVTVTRVVNQFGPQTHPLLSPVRRQVLTSSATNYDVTDRSRLPLPLEERLGNMESHLNLKSGQPVPADVYSRIQTLEKKILHLESLSPEYFADTGPVAKRRRTHSSHKDHISQYQNMSVPELDEKIQMLRERLHSKSRQGQPSV